MRLNRLLTLIFLCLFLQSCASSRMSQELQSGKNCFADANYKEAFRKLLPVAVNGDPQAEYAVGYMYYNGFGVSRDSESGLFWMHKSADQGYGPAIKALNMIHRECVTGYQCPYQVTDEDEKPVRTIYKGDRESMMTSDYHPAPVSHISAHQSYVHPRPQITSARSYAQPEPVQFEHHPATLVSKPKVVSKPAPTPAVTQSFSQAKKYSLQLFGAYHLSDVKSLQQSLDAKKSTQIWHTEHNGKDWYVLTYGKYPSVMQAKLAMDTLPEQVDEYEPWVRNVTGMENVG